MLVKANTSPTAMFHVNLESPKKQYNTAIRTMYLTSYKLPVITLWFLVIEYQHNDVTPVRIYPTAIKQYFGFSANVLQSLEKSKPNISPPVKASNKISTEKMHIKKGKENTLTSLSYSKQPTAVANASRKPRHWDFNGDIIQQRAHKRDRTSCRQLFSI